jgi:hypothetical protein
VSTLIERVEATAAQGLVDRLTWDALPHLLAVARAAEAATKCLWPVGEIPCRVCPPCELAAALEPLLREEGS